VSNWVSIIPGISLYTPVYDIEEFATAFAITPEFRYYPLKKKPAPRGLYLAPNFRYRWYEWEDLYDNSGETVISCNPAIHLGFQLVLKDLFLVDAWVGLAYEISKVVEQTGTGELPEGHSNFGFRMGVAIGLVF
jgi:hypothetical protein